MSIQCQKITKLQTIARAICSDYRIKHILGVEKFIVRLARFYKLDEQSCRIMAWGHDLFRDLDGKVLLNMASSLGYDFSELEAKSPILLHGKLAALYMKRVFNIEGEVFKGIFWHASGYPELPECAKALIVADIAEESRRFPEAISIRENAFNDLEKTYVAVIRLKMNWALNNNLFVLPETVDTWNRYCMGVF
ncbi:hypothetical protein AT15_06905 [Kosmotoga arenicorallina S304]|uniref:HD domain-containing protein n=1 Tax=Kosmotoga arenicorallina S304 TaxID=1453497 RepID=A0A182C721_9BACT|nr:HD domain-containing protein [Kosmotoga arenicorallina]OAA31220.1 hypothetical protein AT15_06905 [Kosmotoga arenicorallina S304]